MFKLSYKLTVRERVQGKCDRHPRYNPEKGGRAGIKGGCSACYSLLDCITPASSWMPPCTSSSDEQDHGRGPGLRESAESQPRLLTASRCLKCCHKGADGGKARDTLCRPPFYAARQRRTVHLLYEHSRAPVQSEEQKQKLTWSSGKKKVQTPSNHGPRP